MNIIENLKLFFNKESEVIRYNEAGIYVKNKENEINGLSYTTSSFYWNEITRSTLRTYAMARKGRKVFKVEVIDPNFVDTYEMNPFYLGNLKSDSFSGHFLRIKENSSEKDLFDMVNQLNDLKGKNRNNKKLINYINFVQEELKNSLPKSTKNWILVYVDEEHVQKFNNFIQQYPSFKFEELNL
ncbi:hypothetical protein [Lysinibacillus fusiformis]|uniref:hypothetical protein n=1 Tax=Lysinibacillus fusiformis TaxID=28031 RepID=UPI0021BFDDFF|nr:hypothetical protein [Lysinibacillus fusiformis]UXJ71334.1 hypothetical protein N5069_24155 [Lysinibacillus fusiformis]